MSKYHIVTWEEDFEETDNVLDARDMVKQLLKKGKKVGVISGNKIDGEQFLKNVKNLYR